VYSRSFVVSERCSLPQVAYANTNESQSCTAIPRNVSELATTNTQPTVTNFDSNTKCWTCDSERQITLACPNKATSTINVKKTSSTIDNSNQNNTTECFVKMITCVPESVASVETQTMPVIVEDVASPSNSLSASVNKDNKRSIRYRTFCRKIEAISNDYQKQVSVHVSQNTVQKQIYT